VIGILSSRVIGVALSYLVHPYRPKLSLAKVAALVNFSKWLLIANALSTARSRAADIIVGRIAGAYALGLYSISYEISNLPTTELSAPINRAVVPGYSVLSGNDEALKEGVRKVMSLIVLITVPAAFGIAAVAEPLVLTLLGAKWAGTVPLIRVLAFFGLVSSLQSNLGYVFLAKGRARFITIWSASMLLLQLPLVIFGALHYGVLGAAMGLLASAVIPMPFVFLFLGRLIGLTLRDWFSIAWRPLLSTAIMSLVLMSWLSLFSPVTGSEGSPLLTLLSSVSLGAVTYALCIVTLWMLARKPSGPEAYLFERAVAFSQRSSN
jgi:O-antigen/teichoic acid export membrane protein